MTREKAIRRVKGYLTDCLPADDYEEVEEIIKALEQEPTNKNDLEKVYNKGYEDGVKSVNICPYCGEYIGEIENDDR